MAYGSDILHEEIENGGVFNITSKKWLIAPNYTVYPNFNGGFMTFRKMPDDQKTELGYFDLKKGWILKTTNEETILIDASSPKLIDFDKKLDYFNAPAGQRTHSKAQQNNYYIFENQKYRIYGADDQLGFITQPKPFVHYNPTYDYYYWLENDSIYIQLEKEVYSVSQNNGKIALTVDKEKAAQATLELIENKDTTLVETHLDGAKFSVSELNFAYSSIERKGDQLILNDTDEYSNIGYFEQEMLEFMAYDEISGMELFTYRTEASSVWELKNGAWQKKTPYYASVTVVPFGYLVKTGSYTWYANETFDKMEDDARYLLLGKNGKARPYLDFYDFKGATVYDYGISVATENGNFFVNNNGKLITTDEWDKFELENGKLKAYRYTVSDFEYHFYADGEEIIAYFELE